MCDTAVSYQDNWLCVEVQWTGMNTCAAVKAYREGFWISFSTNSCTLALTFTSLVDPRWRNSLEWMGGREGGEGRDEGGREGKKAEKNEECSKPVLTHTELINSLLLPSSLYLPLSSLPLPPSSLPPILSPPYNVLINQFNGSLHRHKGDRLEISTRLPEPNVLQTVL